MIPGPLKSVWHTGAILPSLLLPAAVLLLASSLSFISVSTITQEPLHLAWWNSAWTCTLTTSGSLLNINVKGQGHMVFCVFFCVRDTAWTSWPGFTRCCTGTAGGQYLALSKGYLLLLCLLAAVGLVAVGVGDNVLRVWNQSNAVSRYDVQTFWQGIRSKITAVSTAISSVYFYLQWLR